LGFLIALDFGSALSFQKFEFALAKKTITIQFGSLMKGNCLPLFVILALLGFVFLIITLKTEKALKDHYLLNTSKPFFLWICSSILVLFSIAVNLFILFTVV